MTLHRRALLAATLTAPGLAAMATWTRALADGPVPAGPPSLEDLMRKPVLLDAALSPDGERVALLCEIHGGGKRLAYVNLVRVGHFDQQPVRVMVGDADVEQVEWASNSRLLIWLTFDKSDNGKPTGDWYNGEFVPIPVRRVMSIDADGQNTVQLFSNKKLALRADYDLGRVIDMTPDDPDNIIMQGWDVEHDCWGLYRVNVHTGVASQIERGTRATDTWLTQKGVPVVRYDTNQTNTTATVYVRPPGQSDWTLYARFRRDALKKLQDFDIVGETPEPGVLLIAGVMAGDEAVKVRRFDLRTLVPGEVVAQQPGRDIADVFCDEDGVLVAARYVEDRDAYLFSDPKMAAHFKGMNAFFGDRCNVRLHDVDRTHSRFITRVEGPQQPDAFYLYDRAARTYEPLGESRPWLRDRLAGMEILKLKARDGLDLTAYLTVPVKPVAGPRPMVVMPHGGPEVRDGFSYDLWGQALAAQGWLVLQPNFRGSSGYGKAFADAGHHHWGDAMQWDVEDCVDHLIKSGRADRARIAILGASYGGYAAMMGAVLRPDLYRCVVSRAGDCDLHQLLDFSRREDGYQSLSYAWWIKLVGDPKTDDALLDAGSPRRRAGEIKAPMLLFHGTEDAVVTRDSSRDMARAMKKAGKSCDLVEVNGEGHTDWTPEHETKFLERSIAFIARNFQA